MQYANFSQRKVLPRGPLNAPVLVVGEAPGEEEDRLLKAFVGSSGQELDRMLSEARFVTSNIRYTNAINYRPRDNDVEFAFASSKKSAAELGASYIHGRHALQPALEGLKDLANEIALVQPKLIIAVGGTALWATTGKHGIEDWRSSVLDCILAPGIPVVPTYHPAAVLRLWSNRHLAVHDFKRAHGVLQYGIPEPPAWRFRVRPSFATAMECLDLAEAVGQIAVDIETKGGRIVCVGLAWTNLDALCIPFVTRYGTPYWAEEEEVALVQRLQSLLSDPRHQIIGQNFHYDAQYFAREMLVTPTCGWDTMLAQHVLFPGTDKSLAFLSSIYCKHHVFWKDDGKEWNPALHPEEQLWIYNCTDCVKTFDVKSSQEFLIEKYKLTTQMKFVMDVWPHILVTMLRGVKVDKNRKELSKALLKEAIGERKRWLATVIGRDFNPASPKQMKDFFAGEMGITPKKSRKSKGVSFGKENLDKIGDQHIILWPIVQVIKEVRSLGTFLSNFAEAPLDIDGRMRCAYNQGGTESFRLSSSENAFGSGTNLQNIPKGDRSTSMKMPNMRLLFIPDEEMEIGEIDLAGADAQVVAWDADAPGLKAAFRAKQKLHVVNARAMYGDLAGPDGKAEPYYTRIKQGVHLTNYYGQARTLASTINISVSEAERFQAKWFKLHPRITDWHKAIIAELHTTSSILNIFGFRRVYFDRLESIYPEAIAWKPQSTVAIVINEIWRRIGTTPNLPIQVLMQVHDSLVFQYPRARREEVLYKLGKLVEVTVPYADPLVIPLGLTTSEVSWGECKARDWPTRSQALESQFS